jgi:hypothetical protein
MIAMQRLHLPVQQRPQLQAHKGKFSSKTAGKYG